MSGEEPRDGEEKPDEPTDEGGPTEDEEEKGLGLTEEFARLEEEIKREVGAAPESNVDDETGSEEDAEEPGDDAPPAESDESDSADLVAPVPEAGGETEEWQGGEEPPAGEADADAAPDEADDAEDEDPEPSSEEAEIPPEDTAFEHTVVRQGPPPVPMGAYFEPEDDPEIKTPALWWRFMTASVLIVVSIATAISVSSLLLLTDVAADLQPIPGLKDKIDEIKPGDPETILIVGSDKRSDTPGDPGRSDTTMLLRVDPDKQVLSLLSLPRDLKVDIAGANYGSGKLNEAYSYGGVKKTLETVQALTDLEINHVVNVDFFGFAEAVNAIGCVYVDVDRHYFNDNSTALSSLDTFAEINVNAGYQRLCGQNALDYVRYRHTDTDIVRAARQQDFLRNARAQVPVSEVLNIFGGDTGSDLIDIFTKYTSSDIDEAAQMISSLRAFLAVKDVPINQVQLDATLGPSYVEATPEQIDKAVDEFLNGTSSGDGDSLGVEKRGDGGGKAKDENKEPKDDGGSSGANVIPTSDVLDPETGVNKFEAFGRTSARRLRFPVWIPTVVVPGSAYSSDSRQYDIKDENDKKQEAYKLVIQYLTPSTLPEYYGVQGTTWSDPPILEKPSETRTEDGRDYDIYYDGDRVRMVAWQDDQENSYWVSNTLLQTLDEAEMLAIAESMEEAHG